jgi:hypothetical protein
MINASSRNAVKPDDFTKHVVLRGIVTSGLVNIGLRSDVILDYFPGSRPNTTLLPIGTLFN